jgi:hypothetical protein
MSQVNKAEDRLVRLRYALAKTDAMLAALRAEPTYGFTVAAQVRGHFPSSSAYNQTESEEVDRVVAEVLRAILPSVLEQAHLLLRADEWNARSELAAATLALIEERAA